MIGPAFARLSTGMKMLLILSAALLPLGLIALLASIDATRNQRLDRQSQVGVMASDGALKLSGGIARVGMALRTAATRLPASEPRQAICEHLLGDIVLAEAQPVRLGMFDARGGRVCTAGLLAPAPIAMPAAAIGTEVRLIAPGDALRFSVNTGNGMIAVGEFPPEALQKMAAPKTTSDYRLVLRQGDASLWLTNRRLPTGLGEALTVAAPVAGGQLALELTVVTPPLTATGILLGLLPILMWIAAAVIGWLVADRLLLRPLAQMQRAISGYKVEDGPLRLPPMTTPAQEIRALGEAFENVTNRLAAHDAELEEGLARQRRLTREVHHRVKNNLQVVSSLINLHARGVASPDAAAAYSSIQRRVDALAVVHRNHYAELEENRGVGMRSLVGELASNLRATADPGAASLSITLDIAPVFATQDVAVPVSFLITELVELVMICDPRSRVAIQIEQLSDPARALLSVTSAVLASEACLQHPSATRFNRVIEGLSRQLRSKLDRDEETGRYAIEISVVPERLPD